MLVDELQEDVWSLPSETAGERDEAFKGIRAQGRDTSRHNHKTSAENILLPFDVGISFPAPERQASPIFKDTDSREQLQRRRQQNRQRIQELHRIDKRYRSTTKRKSFKPESCGKDDMMTVFTSDP
jgi:hypothetical protein